jgi:hypothetical protein
VSLAGCGLGSEIVHVVNDGVTPVRISICVDESQDVPAGGKFDAQGVPSHGEVMCQVTSKDGRERCVGFRAGDGGASIMHLSDARPAKASQCD